ncbi:MAG: hypothetical protein FWD57_04930, partial [Polyangiaceae bacterium]|nr:hypothetical protein [Polyangiaceae bacterium]
KPNAAVGSSAISIQRSITSRLANYSDCSGLSCRFGFCNWLKVIASFIFSPTSKRATACAGKEYRRVGNHILPRRSATAKVF